MKYGVKIKCLRNFKEIHETFSRMGVGSKKDKILWQSCHLIEENNEFYICHFKECFLLEGSSALLTDDDMNRRDKIILILKNIFKMIEIDDPNFKPNEEVDCHVFILKHSDKSTWKTYPKYVKRTFNKK
jgi:hypothetical protein